jgi:very-short-patch-repair endonuclease
MATRESRHRIQPFMRQLAADNRHEPTHPERLLWSLFRKSQLGGLKFRRQAVIGPYIVDFLCPQKKLVIEVDGESHEGRESDDRVRDTYLRQRGYRAVRAMNDDVLHDLEAVGMEILKQAGELDVQGEIRTRPTP